MATAMSSILTQARSHLNEDTSSFWTDTELLLIANNGIKDLWRRLNDLFKHYFITIDITNVTLAASSSSLAGVPTDVFRIVTVEPRVVGSSNPNPGLIFVPAGYNDPRFVNARAQGPVEPKNVVIFYEVMNPGAPVGAPMIRIAPQVSSAVNLALVYNQVLAAVVAASNNPIPGESDNALIAWTVAYARARERDDRAPDPEWLAVYATDKAALCRELTPRQIQEPEVVQGMFEGDEFGWGY